MFAKGNINKRLIAKYLTGNCSAPEKLRVEQWISASGKNAELFDQYKTVWTYTAPVADIPAFDGEAALDKVHKQIEVMEKSPVITIQRKPSALRAAYRYAAGIAAVLMIAFTAYFFIQNQSGVETTTFTAEAKVLEPIILPDGSRVYLNTGATITYPEVFDKKDRQVAITGEAFFEVESDATWPFVVTTGNLGIKVLGTSFNVNAGENMPTVEVTIQSGRVMFYSCNTKSGEIQEQIILNSGEKGIYYKTDGLIARTTTENFNSIGWKSGLLEFNNTPLPEVFKAIENAYDLTIDCERNCDQLHLTARFEKEEPENVLETLRLIFGFQIQENNGQVRIF